MPLLTFALSLLACGPEPTLIDGTVNGEKLAEPLTVLWGGPFVLFVDEDLGCRDVDWVRRTYDAETAPYDQDLVALQFAFDDEETLEGLFSVSGSNAAVAAKAVIIKGGEFTELRARDGNLNIESIEDEYMTGSFSADFGEDADGNALGSWTTEFYGAEYCVNLIRD